MPCDLQPNMCLNSNIQWLDQTKWNPRMEPYISSKCKGIHIINLIRTARFLSDFISMNF